MSLPVNAASNVYSLAGAARRGYSLQTPVTGFAITIGNNVDVLGLEPAGTLATGTICDAERADRKPELRANSCERTDDSCPPWFIPLEIQQHHQVVSAGPN
ncbi:hypothetical protein [Paraburkholderia sp. D1E]|uniref:hypothetical protein n=1 Tax=Paraburkholderia sp. D1E TaxID=3461398 RepID=UPI00404573B1